MAKKGKRKIMWFIVMIVVVIFVSLLAYFFEPLFLRRSFIERVSMLEIPRTAPIIEYQFGITSFGIQPFFAKLELTQGEYDILRPLFTAYQESLRPLFTTDQEYLQVVHRLEHQHFESFYLMKQDFGYTSISIDDIEEIGWCDRLTGRTSIFLAGTSKLTQMILIATSDGEHFLYVFHN